MLSRLLQIFDSTAPSPGTGDPLPMAVATLLGEAALSDGHLAAAEKAAIAQLLARRFDLDEIAAAAIAERGLEHAQSSTDLWRAARQVNEALDEAGKIDLLADLWRIVLADGRIDDFEAALMRKLAGLLYVRDQDAGAARKRAEAD